MTCTRYRSGLMAGILELEGMLDEEGKLVVSNENSLLQTKYGLLLQKKYLERNRRFYRSCRHCTGIRNRTGPGK